MGMLQEGLEELKISIRLVAENFYQQKNQIGYTQMIRIIDDLTAISAILEVNKEREDVSGLSKSLTEVLQAIIVAMEQKDTVLIADTMSYDLLELIDQIIDIKLG